jgi:hypothetical protein
MVTIDAVSPEFRELVDSDGTFEVLSNHRLSDIEKPGLRIGSSAHIFFR